MIYRIFRTLIVANIFGSLAMFYFADQTSEVLNLIHEGKWNSAEGRIKSFANVPSVQNYLYGVLFQNGEYPKHSLSAATQSLEYSAKMGLLQAKIDLIYLYLDVDDWEKTNVNQAIYWGKDILKNSLDGNQIKDEYFPIVASFFVNGIVLKKNVVNAYKVCSLMQEPDEYCEAIKVKFGILMDSESKEALKEFEESLTEEIYSGKFFNF